MVAITSHETDSIQHKIPYSKLFCIPTCCRHTFEYEYHTTKMNQKGKCCYTKFEYLAGGCCWYPNSTVISTEKQRFYSLLNSLISKQVHELKTFRFELKKEVSRMRARSKKGFNSRFCTMNST